MVWAPKYRKRLLVGELKDYLEEIFRGVGERYEMKVEEIGIQKDHVHLFVEIAPRYSVSESVRIFKSITAREIFRRVPEVKKQLWGGEFWTKGYFISTIGIHGNEETIQKYIKEQGTEKEYKIIHKEQLKLF